MKVQCQDIFQTQSVTQQLCGPTSCATIFSQSPQLHMIKLYQTGLLRKLDQCQENGGEGGEAGFTVLGQVVALLTRARAFVTPGGWLGERSCDHCTCNLTLEYTVSTVADVIYILCMTVLLFCVVLVDDYLTFFPISTDLISESMGWDEVGVRCGYR